MILVLLLLAHYLYFFFNLYVAVCMCAYLLSHVQLFATPRIVAPQAPVSMGFSRQENTGVGSHSLLQGIFLT